MTVYAGIEPHLYIHTPTPLFKARVNMPGAVTYPITAITFDTVSLGAYTDLEFDMTLVLGSTDGADDLGRVRVQKTATSTQIPVARVSRGVEDGSLEIVDNAYITVYADDFRVWAKLPWQSPDGVDYKDGDVPVGDFLVEIPPVANMGAGFADYIDDDDVITVTFDGSSSYAMADGATIATYAWDIGDGIVVAGDIDEDTLTVEFPAGFRYVSLTVVDSNGVPNTSRRPVLAVDPANDVTIRTADVESQRFTQQGQTLRVKFPTDLPRTTYPDGTLCMLWWDAPANPADRSHMKFIGWHQSDDAALRAQKPGLVRETTLEFVDVAGRLDSLPGFPQALQREDDPGVDEQWSLMPDLDINKALHYLIFWHSTALGLADFFLPADGDDYPSMRLDSTGSTLYDQINSRALSMTPDHMLTCDAQGTLRVLKDWMLVNVGDRPLAAPILIEDDLGDITFPYQRPPRVHVLRSSAIVSSTDWVMLGGEKTLPLAFAIAPGEAFSQGTNEQTEAEGLTQSQAQLNTATGHKYARLNARFGPARAQLLDPTAIWDYLPALMPRIQLNIASQYAAQRGLPFTSTQAMVKELTINYRNGKQGLAIEADVTLELETSGPPAVTHIPEVEGTQDDYEAPPIPPPTLPPPMGGGGPALVAGVGINGHVYRTYNFGVATPTWDDHNLSVGNVYSWVVDPFSPGYIDGSGAINGWVVGDTAIYRVLDLFGTPSATAVFTFPTATSMGSYHWRSIQASFGAYFGPGANPWLLCVSYYGDTSGHEGTWATYSTDGGVTWAAEVQISSLYDPGLATRFMPIGVYASPKTPGLAYCVAHVATVTGELPRWGSSTGGANFTLGSGGAAKFSISRTYNAPPTGQNIRWLMIGPPKDAVRVKLQGHWRSTLAVSGSGVGGGSMDTNDGHSTQIHESINTLTYTPPAANATTEGNFIYEATRTGLTEWPGFSTTVTPSAETGTRIKIQPSGQAIGAGSTVQNDMFLELACIEIEMEDGTIYNPSESATKMFVTHDWGATWEETDFADPGMGMGGSIHLPWAMNADEQLAYYGHFDNSANREFRLMKSQGGIQTDVSPNDGSRSYGPNRYGFAIRAFDPDRSYLLAAVTGNDTSTDPANDKHAVFASTNEGGTWTQVIAPTADSAAPTGRAAYEAAYGPTDPNEMFIWGKPAWMAYSDDGGASVDDKSGNLGALGAAGFVGIAGGVA